MLNNLTTKKDIRTFSICPEHPTGEKGKGGMIPLEQGTAAWAARELGTGWKVNPYIVLPAGETAILADVQGMGAIKHFWITDGAKAGRLLLLRIYFDGQKNPAVEVPLSDLNIETPTDMYFKVGIKAGGREKDLTFNIAMTW